MGTGCERIPVTDLTSARRAGASSRGRSFDPEREKLTSILSLQPRSAQGVDKRRHGSVEAAAALLGDLR